MTNRNTRRGFTLIELLVVVLIIGILAAVAVPQYQKAVWKSRTAGAVVNMKALRTALEAYIQGGGVAFTTNDTDVSALDITFPFVTCDDVLVSNGKETWHPVQCDNNGFRYIVYTSHSGYDAVTVEKRTPNGIVNIQYSRSRISYPWTPEETKKYLGKWTSHCYYPKEDKMWKSICETLGFTARESDM